MTMTMKALFNGVAADMPDREVTSIEYDSRKVARGSCFVAVKGFHVDGHGFTRDAAARGASVLVVEAGVPADVPSGIPVVRVADSRRELARLAARFHGSPSGRLGVIGITGTNGKTTTSYLLQHMLNLAGHRTSRFGTVEYDFPDGPVPAPNTTPESADLQRMFAKAASFANARCVMEVSSHGLALGRLERTVFKGAVFTNLTQDHLDFHKTMEEYEKAKRLLFTGFALEYTVINADDPAGRRWATEGVKGRLITYGRASDALVRLAGSSGDFRGGHMDLETPLGAVRLDIPLPGGHNLQNAMAAFCAGLAEGLPVDIIKRGIAEVPPVPGRFQKVDEGQDFAVIVDYAHTDNALENVLTTARGITKKRLLCVFGCGGDRDRGKRPKMGKVACGLADLVFVTSDNPRTEDQRQIINDILAGVPSDCRGRLAVYPDREEAIRRAVEAAGPGDLLLIAGKGHEACQIIGNEKIPFDDRTVAAKYLKERR